MSTPPRSRLLALDAFRGLTIVGMLLVNNVALDVDTPLQLLHAPWNQGVTFADLVFPWFLFIVGVAIPLASRRNVKSAAIRALKLIALGILIDCSEARQIAVGLDVLQLIGMAYFIAMLYAELDTTRRLWLAAMMLIWNWAVARLIPVPGHPAGTFTQDVNVFAYADHFLAPWHLRGILSAIPTAAMVLLGTVAGDVLRSDRGQADKLRWMARYGALLGVLGLLWSLSIPFNKPVWTSSYILYGAGTATLTLAAIYWMLDVRGWHQAWFPFTVFGMNAIAAYFVPIIVKLHTIGEWKIHLQEGFTVTVQDALQNSFYRHFGRVPGGWLYTLLYIGVCWLFVYGMYRRRVFWKV
ncbi:MAG: acyltransferase family protein [Candidatus Xenobia bacterium]